MAEPQPPPVALGPVDFSTHILSLASSALIALGRMPAPDGVQQPLDLETAKHLIDVLAMLREKTNGNLHEKEAKLLEGLLADLRMQYVTMVRATEEKLKAQAAKKFSGADILGKK